MDISPVTTTYSTDDNSWMGSEHGTDCTLSITLDLTAGFVAGTHYPDGYLKSGLPLGKITASGKYGLYDDAAVDGRTTLVGFLYGGVKVGSTTAVPVGAALLWHGVVRQSRLPTPGVDANGKTDVANKILFI